MTLASSLVLIRTLLYSVSFFIAIVAASAPARARDVHHYVFLNRDRERIHDETFLRTTALEGAQLKYTWRELEPEKDHYEFDAIERDLLFLQSKGKKLFIQVQDTSFDTNSVLVPRYLQKESQYHGGVDPQYDIQGEDEEHAIPAGWVARRWDPPVRERFERLLLALGRRFDGRIQGINLPETAVDFGERGRLFPQGFTPGVYLDAVINTMTVLKRAFPHSVAMQYANFMPGGKPDLRIIYATAKELNVAMGGPDLMPSKPGQMQNSYPLIHEYSGSILMGVAVQEGNYEHKNPKTGRQVTLSEILAFATDYLGVDYIFWCTQEPYYSKMLIPYFATLEDKPSIRQK